MKPLPSPHIPGHDFATIAQVLLISDELGTYTALDDMLRHAVALARDRLKLERVAIFLRDDKDGLMRGTFGTGLRGETVDERWHAHPVTPTQCDALRQLAPQGMLWNYDEDVELQVVRPRRRLVVGRGWLTTTPLLAAGRVVGVMYADAALSGSAFDAEKQAHAALLCGALANLVYAKRAVPTGDSPGGQGQPTRVGDHRWSDDGGDCASFQSYRRSRDYLEEHYLSLRNLADFSKACHLTQTYLCRLFHRYEGCSPYKRLLRLKMGHAASLLRDPAVSVKRAGLEVGFDDPYHFSKTFKQVLGVPPTSLRDR